MTETLSPALPADVEALVQRVLRGAHEQAVALVTAESCTGGLLASILTDVDGLGHTFDRGFVTYSTPSKQHLLGVPAELLDRCGPVSEPVARAMAEGALARADGQLALAVTGFCGPSGPDEPQGRVHFALARRGGETAHRREEFGAVDRGEARLRCLRVGLAMFADALG
jgi:nicotinamide-nucleotide amidase